MQVPTALPSLVFAILSLAHTPLATQSVSAPKKQLPVAGGELFRVAGHPAFLIRPEQGTDAPVPWVWYAPTLPRLPGKAETKMFEQFLAAGIAIAGVDVGESYGSPSGRAVYTALYEELVKKRGMAKRACLLARSRGGLMLYNWAAEHPRAVACLAGIYPVCDLASWPGLEKASPAFGMTEMELATALRAHNPIDRLVPLARAGVPIFHLHGDKDRVVPLAQNSSELWKRYQKLGGTMVLEIPEGRGHDMWRGWFESSDLIAFVVAHARAARSNATTRGVVDAGDDRRPPDALQLVGPEGSKLVPENDEIECKWAFEDGVLTASPKWDSVVTPKAYRDFRMHVEFNVNEAEDTNPEGKGNSGVYLQMRYELQILDSHGISAEDYKASDCGSLYRLKKPDLLVSRKAGVWQSYDIVFRAARFDGDKKIANARITAYQNGSLIHDDFEIPRKTGAGEKEGPGARPVKLQGHHNEVRFRNVWIQELNLDG